MNLAVICENILFSEQLDQKIIAIDEMTSLDGSTQRDRPKIPLRAQGMQFSPKGQKFPKASQFHRKEMRLNAVHFFANHELLAVEMLAYAILYFTNEKDLKTRKTLASILRDEIEHFNLYQALMTENGMKFGDRPVNGFFWKYLEEVENIQQFFALTSLTFENANLDFAAYYSELFYEVGDLEMAEVMDRIYRDEIGHVAHGARILEQKSGREELWNYYVSLLPAKISPARAKGQNFKKIAREKAGLSESFILNLANYRDDFEITDRKQWK